MNIRLRRYFDSDCEITAKLFYDTVHAVNARDYTEKQLSAWANGEDDLKKRHKDLTEQYTLIAEADGEIAGFGSIDKTGCLDMLYVHKDFQRLGIAAKLCDELEKGFEDITVYASITAKSFFEKRGYVVLKAQEVERRGVKLKNFVMKKSVKT